MPVTETICGEGCKIECWKLTESTVELQGLCVESGIETINTFNLEARYRQYLATNLLFRRMFGPEDEVLKYQPTGKPYVSEGKFISISHSGDVIVMMRSHVECGVDIELLHSRIEKVKHKFLTDEELARVKDQDFHTLVQYWTAKEAMFKVFGSQDVFMRSHIFVTGVQPLSAQCELRYGNLIVVRDIRYRQIGNMLLAWTESNHGE